MLGFGIYRLILQRLPKKILPVLTRLENWLVILLVTVLLARSWQPLGIEKGEWSNFFFVALLIGGLLGTFQVFQWLYPQLLRIFLRWKLTFLAVPVLIIIGGAMVWLGVPKLTAWLPDSIRRTQPKASTAASSNWLLRPSTSFTRSFWFRICPSQTAPSPSSPAVERTQIQGVMQGLRCLSGASGQILK